VIPLFWIVRVHSLDQGIDKARGSFCVGHSGSYRQLFC
jgi:hypothetical protein